MNNRNGSCIVHTYLQPNLNTFWLQNIYVLKHNSTPCIFRVCFVAFIAVCSYAPLQLHYLHI